VAARVREGGGDRHRQARSSAAEDLEQLRRENAKLKMEIEILKKAAIYFAREAK